MTDVIIDADHSNDADDVADQAHLIALGMNVVGAILSDSNAHAPGALAAVYQHMTGSHPPVASWQTTSNDPGSAFTQQLYNEYPHPGVGLSNTLPRGVDLYYDLLEAATEPVAVLITGGLNQFAELLQAPGGLALVATKVSVVVVVAGHDNGTDEYNVRLDPAAAACVAAHCPVLLVHLSCTIGGPIGSGIIIGQNNWHGNLPADCPVARAFNLNGFGSSGRNAWTNLAIEYLADTGVYDLVPGWWTVNPYTSVDTFTEDPAGPHLQLRTTLTNAEYAARWEAAIVAHHQDPEEPPLPCCGTYSGIYDVTDDRDLVLADLHALLKFTGAAKLTIPFDFSTDWPEGGRVDLGRFSSQARVEGAPGVDVNDGEIAVGRGGATLTRLGMNEWWLVGNVA